MSDVIPDPDQPERLGIAPDGRMVYGIHAAKITDDGQPPRPADFHFAGWCYGITIGKIEDQP